MSHVEIPRADGVDYGEPDEDRRNYKPRECRLRERCRGSMNTGREEADCDRKREDFHAVVAQRIDPQGAGDDASGVEAQDDQAQEPCRSP